MGQRYRRHDRNRSWSRRSARRAAGRRAWCRTLTRASGAAAAAGGGRRSAPGSGRSGSARGSAAAVVAAAGADVAVSGRETRRARAAPAGREAPDPRSQLKMTGLLSSRTRSATGGDLRASMVVTCSTTT